MFMNELEVSEHVVADVSESEILQATTLDKDLDPHAIMEFKDLTMEPTSTDVEFEGATTTALEKNRYYIPENVDLEARMVEPRRSVRGGCRRGTRAPRCGTLW